MDPVEVGFGHKMWYESDSRRFKCSFHDLWSRDFLAAKPEEWGAFRKDAFVTFETTTLTVAAFVVSPQIDALPDAKPVPCISLLLAALHDLLTGTVPSSCPIRCLMRWLFRCLMP